MSGRKARCNPGCAQDGRIRSEASQGSRSDDTAGNFLLGDCFCDVRCRHGHEIRLFNIGRGHFVACDRCRTFIFVGSNLMSRWRAESEDIWRANSRSVEGYEFIE